MKHIKHSRAHWLQTHYNGGEGLVTIADCISGSIQVYATKKYIMHLAPYEYKTHSVCYVWTPLKNSHLRYCRHFVLSQMHLHRFVYNQNL